MTQSNNKKLPPSYEDATGEIEFTLKSDIMFHYVMQKSKEALTGLVCALKGISPSEVKNVVVMNPIDLNNAGKETFMDLKLILNSGEILNIELQMYFDKHWTPRSILYLCRAYDSIGSGDDYSKLKPTTLYCITDQNLLPDAPPEFYAHYLLLNTKNHHIYTKNFGINVLQLNNKSLATEDDITNNLVFWSELLMATTWEQFKALAKDNLAIKEVGNLILELNYDNQAKELLEGQRRYREVMATQYADGYADAEEKFSSELKSLNNVIAEKDAAIAELQAKLKAYENQQ